MEAHEAEDGGSGHWEDQDGDGNDDTWVPGTIWFDGQYEDHWIVDGYYADGEFGSTWTTSSGVYHIDSGDSSCSSSTSRGFLLYPINLGEQVTFMNWAAASNNVGYFSSKVYTPSNVEYVSRTFSAAPSPSGVYVTPYEAGLWRIEIGYHNATGITPTTATVTYYFSVGPVSQTINFPTIARHSHGDPAFDPAATATSGLPVAYAIVSGPATISNGAVLVTGDGTVTVRASQNGATVGATIWAAAPSVDRSFTVSGTAQTISFPVIANRAFGDPPFAISATATSGLPVSFTVAAGSATVSGSTVTLTGGGSVTITASQSGNTAYGPAPSVSRTFVVAPDVTAPSVPASLVTSDLKATAVTLSWSASTDYVGVTQYEVQRNGTVVGTSVSPTLNVTGLSAATTYSLTVRARDSSGNWSTPSTALSVTTLPYTVPRMALQYWQTGDYPNKPHGHNEPVWVEGHNEEIGEGIGHFEDRDGDGNDDTWVPDTQWVDGYYYYYWVQDGVYPDGQYGSLWSTSTGTYSAADSSGSAAEASRGYLLSPHPYGAGSMRAAFTVPSENCNIFAISVVNPNSSVIGSWGTNQAGDGTTTLGGDNINLGWAGCWRIVLQYAGATNVTPASGGVNYYMWVGNPQTINFTTIPNHSCGDVPFALTATASSGLPVEYSIVSGPATVSGNTVTLTGEGAVVVRAYQVGGVNGTTYTSTYVDQSFTVRGNPQTITFPALADVTFGTAPPTLNATSTSGLPVVYSIVSGPATISGNALALTGVGTVTVAANQAGAGVYGPAQPVIRTFAINKASQTITFPDVGSHMYGDSPFPISATASSGLPVVFSATGPATLSGNIVTLTGTGNVTLTVSQAGNANYNAATNATRTFAAGRIPGRYYVTVVDGTAQAISGVPGTTVALTANPLPDGYGFMGWSVTNGVGTIANASSMTAATLTLGSSDVTVTASSVPFYTVTIQNGTIAVPGGTASSVSGPAGKVLDITANADGGGQYFVNWSLPSGAGGYSTLTERTARFTIAASNATLRANYVSAHSLIVRSIGPEGFGFVTGTQSSAGGIRGSTISIWANKPSASRSIYFDGWTVNSGAGMIADPGGVNTESTGTGTFIMGNSDAIVVGWYVFPEYRQNEITTTLTSAASAAPGQSFNVTAISTAPSNAVVTDMTISATADYGDTWTTPSGWSWQGSANSNTFVKSTNASAPGVMFFRAQGSRSGGGTTYASLPVFARVPIMAGGTLTISGGHADGSLSGQPGTVIPIHADVPSNSVFVRWKITAGAGAIANETSPNTTFMIVENPAPGSNGTPAGAVIQAEYQSVYPLTVVNGSASLAGGPPGTVITITAGTSTDFAGWTLDNVSMGAGTIANPSSPTTTFTMGNAGALVRANYGNTLQKVSLWGATVTERTGLFNTSVPITANPAADGFYFDRWDFVGAPHGTLAYQFSRSTTFTFGMGDSILEAGYDVGATLTVTNGYADYDGGRSGRAIRIHPDIPAGNVFTGWERTSAAATGSIANSTNPETTYVMGTGNAAVRANYVPKPPPPVVTGASLSTTVGASFSHTIQATNMSYAGSSYAASPLAPNPGGLTLNPTTGVISGTPLHAGNYSITISATNVTATGNATLSLSVAKAAQTVTFGALANKTTNDAAFALTATTTSPLTVTYSVVSGPITISGNVVEITSVGNATIRASQAGDNDYFAASAVDRSFTITSGATGVAPSIAIPPVGADLTVGQTAIFRVTAAGSDPLSYQWRRNGVNLTNGGAIVGATTAQLTISAVILADSGTYDVVVTNPSGSVQSAGALLGVTSASGVGIELIVHRP